MTEARRIFRSTGAGKPLYFLLQGKRSLWDSYTWGIRDRQPPDGYRLSKILMDPLTGMPKEPSTSNTAAINVMSNPNNANCPSRCFRPVDVAFDAKGRLFMTSDTTSEVWYIGGT